MTFAYPTTDFECPRCGVADASRVSKDEGARYKIQLTCNDCECEWSEWEDK